ncbi:L-serine ammonia-lyase, iron-sulfur-dependent, subunit alpha [Clostridium algidicarnis]|uniref:L-cysteine desulfidase family protein n=1 Tax=Clostridium algidicarnis TaxID=37659 RepID=UPI001C0D7782|nr:L-serine ammonia-lyase, iron-sulfur-dependent, subunit alpha [Clostridium algidicarnis]MBU3195892.1 L-serine ammonia-lyase, iron-sulfur-dependent, subunit alpha [Clostridium algidicarnis]
MDNNIYIELLKREVVPALGCTEPIAIAYATSKCKELLKGEIESINLFLSANIIKNALGVGIPGTGMIGIDIAAALGFIGGDSKLELQVLNNVTKEHIDTAKSMVDQGKVKIELKENCDKLYIETHCKTKDHIAKVIISGNHNNIVKIELDENIILDNVHNGFKNEDCNIGKKITVESIYNFATNVEFKSIEFLLEGAKMNKLVSDEGLQGDYGLNVGKRLFNSTSIVLGGDSLQNRIVASTAAASDARMSGCTMPIMTTSGSGNQGITATIPSVILSAELRKSDEELARALAISNLVTIHVKSYIGRLSALCGAGIAASIGSSAAITYLLDGKLKNIKYAIKNMIANISGMICDGAKTTCAMKIATGVNAAIQCATLALNDIEPMGNEGIVGINVEKSIENLGTLGVKGMENTDKTILNMMLNR